jgi:outer membrane protein assembly factor BamB
LRGLAILCAVPLLASAQNNAITFEQAWVEKTPGGIYGGVHADDTLLFAAGEDRIVRALDQATGKEEWRARTEAPIGSAVASDDQRVYFHSRDGVVHALQKSDGEPLWTFATGGERQWDYWDYYLSTPAVDDRQVYFGSGDHHVYALDKRTGHLRWKIKTGNIVHGRPVISGEKVIVGSFDGRLYAIDRGTGRTLWTFKTVGTAYFRNGELPGTAAVADGLVYAGGRDYNIYALLEDTGTGAWNDKTPSWIIGTPLVVDDELIVVNSDGAGVFSYNRSSGQLNWETRTSFNMFAGAKPLGSGHLAVPGLDGRITVLNRADGSTAGVYATDASRSQRDSFFNADGTIDYSGVSSLEDLMDWYDRLLQDTGGITGDIVVQGDMIFYATASGEIAAVRVSGIEQD